MSDWKMYLNQNGDFELANFLYKTINNLMKQSLDMGTLLSNDQIKLRAYKEQTKTIRRDESSMTPPKKLYHRTECLLSIVSL